MGPPSRPRGEPGGSATAFFPATGAVDADFPALLRVMRRAAEASGRDGEAIMVTASCPGIDGPDPLAAVEARRSLGVHRVAIPSSLFGPEPEVAIAAFGERVIAPSQR